MESQSYSSSFTIPPPPPPPQPPFHSALHSVRKIPAKPWKKPIAPPTPLRVYKVKPVDFKQLVQKLTGAAEFHSRRLQSVAPPPLTLSTAMSRDSDNKAAAAAAGGPILEHLLLPNTATPPLSATYRDLMAETLADAKPPKLSDSLGSVSQLGFGLSPSSSSHAWCSFFLMSPGTTSSLEQSTVL